MSNSSKGAYKEIGNHVNKFDKSDTVSSVAFITEPQSSVLNPMLNQCYLSMNTNQKASDETEPFDSRLNESESSDHELTVVDKEATVDVGHGNFDPEIHPPPFHDDTFAMNNSVPDIRPVGESINSEFMDTLAKNVSCVSECARPEMVMNCAKGSMHNLGYISDSESVKETVLADLTSSLNKTHTRWRR